MADTHKCHAFIITVKKILWANCGGGNCPVVGNFLI